MSGMTRSERRMMKVKIVMMVAFQSLKVCLSKLVRFHHVLIFRPSWWPLWVLVHRILLQSLSRTHEGEWKKEVLQRHEMELFWHLKTCLNLQDIFISALDCITSHPLLNKLLDKDVLEVMLSVVVEVTRGNSEITHKYDQIQSLISNFKL